MGKKEGEKKKKLTKSERLKLQQEEEERRLKEEEEARLKAEREAAEKLEREQVEKRKWEELVEKDQLRRTEEFEELFLLEKCFIDAEKWKKEVRNLSKWFHYIKCDGSPDPSVAPEMNTFISLWKEKENEDIDAVIKQSKLVLELIEKLELVLLDTPPHELTDNQVAQYQTSIMELRELLHFKFNEATETLLRQASSFGDTDSGNMEMIIKDENVTLYVWANLKKNPKYKTIKFGDTDIGFTIPKLLASSDTAVRIFHTNYDHISPLSVVPRPVKTEIIDAIIEDFTNIETTQEEAVPQEGSEEVAEEQELEIVPTVPEGEVKMEESTLFIRQSNLSVSKEEVESKKEEPVVKRSKKEQILPGPVETIPEVPQAEVPTDEEVVDLKGFTPLGGIYHLNILQLPPQAKQIKGWTIVEVSPSLPPLPEQEEASLDKKKKLISGGLQKFVYPPEHTDDNPESENHHKPIEFVITINRNVVFFEKPMMARWDTEGKAWRTDGFISLYYDMAERNISFSLETVYPVTLIQDNHIHMPYESWELRPVGDNEVILNVTTTFTDIDIHVKDSQCMLAAVEVGENYELSHLLKKWMNISSLIIAMKQTGLNIFPSEYSGAYVAVNDKDPLVEMKTYRQMALLASSFSFCWSKWNQACGPQNVILKVGELLKKEYVEDDEWSIYMYNGERAQKLKINESSNTFSGELEEHTELHSTLYHMIKDFASKEAMEKIRNSNYLFVDAVCKLLLSVRVLTYS
ncbi:dynein axonemal intermediate chain 7 isoform X3 [Monodelphis domestica]|uniref:Dynein axonemal intermediate chain 7 n=1 Tax=Monodelphis domestica TaxID=13616 RepID=A0A5F8G3U3_MONDO|nr:dynein axonemal intermediate chain 7 isoform X3 [Monodelphis domestica]